MKCAISSYSSRSDNTKANGASPTTETQNSCHNDAAKRDSAVTLDDNAKTPAIQRLKKPCRSGAAKSTKCNLMNMGMFSLASLT